MKQSKSEQQVQWLAYAYEGLMSIAMKRLQSVPKSEDAVSAAMESAMIQIRENKCRAETKERFFAWVHQIVRWRCSKRLNQGSNDLPLDTGAKYMRLDARRDRRSSTVKTTEDDSWQKDCYTRNEDIE
jgi:DNA-directed RNA polymerase specialized sigma24 family protein